MKIVYSTMNGQKVKTEMSREEAAERLAYLDNQEQYTKMVAPTDSGMVRIDYLREAEAIRKVL